MIYKTETKNLIIKIHNFSIIKDDSLVYILLRNSFNLLKSNDFSAQNRKKNQSRS